MTAPGGVRRWTLHRRDCKNEGGYGEFRDRFSPWIECKWPNEPHDPPVERPYKTGPNATHVELVEAAAYDALAAKLADRDADVEELMLCLHGIKHWGYCKNNLLTNPGENAPVCIRCQLEQAERERKYFEEAGIEAQREKERAEKERDDAVSIVREMREMCTCLSGAAASLIDAFLSRVGAKEKK